MAGDLKVANIQGLSPGFTVELDGDSVLEVEGDLRLQGQSYAPIPGGPDNEKPLNPKYGSTWMNTWTGKLEYWKGPGKGGWDYINPGTAAGCPSWGVALGKPGEDPTLKGAHQLRTLLVPGSSSSFRGVKKLARGPSRGFWHQIYAQLIWGKGLFSPSR